MNLIKDYVLLYPHDRGILHYYIFIFPEEAKTLQKFLFNAQSSDIWVI